MNEEVKKETPIEEVNIDQPIDFEEEEQKTIWELKIYTTT